MRLMKPNVNMNGTTRQSLVDQRRAVLDALELVSNAMRGMAPHGRDYQGLPTAEESLKRYQHDRDLWDARFEEVHRIYKEIEAEALAIHNEEY